MVNIYNEEVRKYAVKRIRDRVTGNFGSATAVELAVETEKKSGFVRLIRHRNEIKGFFDYSKDVPLEVAGSAFDMIGSSQKVHDVTQFYMNNLTLRELFSAYAGSSLIVLGKIIQLNLVIELNFSDGTVGFFSIIGVDGPGNFRFKFSSGVDADGNSIKPDAVNLSGSYRYSEGGYIAIESFIRALERLGVKVDRVGFEKGGAGSGTISDIKLECNPKTGRCRFVKIK